MFWHTIRLIVIFLQWNANQCHIVRMFLLDNRIFLWRADISYIEDSSLIRSCFVWRWNRCNRLNLHFHWKGYIFYYMNCSYLPENQVCMCLPGLSKSFHKSMDWWCSDVMCEPEKRKRTCLWYWAIFSSVGKSKKLINVRLTANFILFRYVGIEIRETNSLSTRGSVIWSKPWIMIPNLQFWEYAIVSNRGSYLSSGYNIPAKRIFDGSNVFLIESGYKSIKSSFKNRTAARIPSSSAHCVIL